MKHLALIAAALLLAACARESAEGEAAPAPTAAESAFFEVAADAKAGKVLATLPAPGDDGVMLRAIHASGLTAGLGSNPVGLDRGAGGGGRIIAFRRIGPKIVIEQENWTYRASAENPLEKRAVANSFARSFLWSTDVVEEKAGGGIVIDLAGFLTSDVMDIKGSLKSAGQDGYAIVADRTFPDYSSVLVFPDNVEIDAYVTFASDKAGREVEATAADGRAFTLIQHHSFVRLPEPGFEPRDFDTRIAAIDVSYYDFSAPLDAPIVKAFARRFRLERVDPNAVSGPVKKPIVFYVDSGAPEPIRSALIEGASWWAEAFEAAGFEDAYRVELLPQGVHPLDIRYNVVQWVHRQTRGWSYGGGIYDPRTGEMLKAEVVLGSQRVRQDRMIFEGLAGAEKSGTGAADDPVEIALARIRQLSAHEVGHTLGFAHNFAASTNDRASVMDYPAPLVRPTPDGGLDFSAAYGVGIGDWDKAAVHWLYGEFPLNEKATLDKIITDAYGAGLRFVDDAQARSVSSGNPNASVWDNGEDAVTMLAETMRVREIALSRFGERSLRDGQPTSDLRAIIVPVYLYHRYQVAAAAKLVGGYDFRYAVKGDGPAAGAPVSPDRQRAALAGLVATLRPAALDLPDATLDRLTTSLSSFGGGGAGAELFDDDADPMFDLLRAADAAGAETMRALLHPKRLARLIETGRRDNAALRTEEALAAIEQVVFATPPTPRQTEIARTLQTRFVSTLIEIAAGAAPAGESQAATSFLAFGPGDRATPAVEARVDAYLRALNGRIGLGGGPAEGAHRVWLRSLIDAHLDREAPPRRSSAPAAKVPAGPPIGSPLGEECWFCDLR